MLKLKETREKRKMTQEALAKKVGVAQGFISNLENGNCSPSFEVFIRLARALDCSLDELVDMEGDSIAS